MQTKKKGHDSGEEGPITLGAPILQRSREKIPTSLYGQSASAHNHIFDEIFKKIIFKEIGYVMH
jgi:hypothetical protein